MHKIARHSGWVNDLDEMNFTESVVVRTAISTLWYYYYSSNVLLRIIFADVSRCVSRKRKAISFPPIPSPCSIRVENWVNKSKCVGIVDAGSQTPFNLGERETLAIPRLDTRVRVGTLVGIPTSTKVIYHEIRRRYDQSY